MWGVVVVNEQSRGRGGRCCGRGRGGTREREDAKGDISREKSR